MRQVFAVSLFVVALAAAHSAQAFSGVCADRDAATKLLAERYNEKQVASGVTRSGGLFELFSDKSGSNWSVLLTRPNGLSCIVALGSDLVAEAIPAEEQVVLPEM